MVSDQPIENLGEYLRAQRTAQRVSLEELSVRTRIAGRFLEAIEENRFDLLPNSVSARGFLKLYARALALSEEPILRRHGELTGQVDPPLNGSNEDPVKPLIRPAPAAEPISKTMKLWIPMGILGAVVLLVWTVSRGTLERVDPSRLGSSEPERAEDQIDSPPVSQGPVQLQPSGAVNLPASPPVFLGAPSQTIPQATPQAPTTVKPPEVSATPPDPPAEPPALFPKSPAPPVPSRTISSPPGAVGPLVLLLEAVEPSWVEVMIDNNTSREALLQPGEKIRWEAQERFLLTLGNAGGIKVIYNGQPLERFGPSGRVAKKILLTR
jgi:cytoskeletal protein RodZ